MTSIDILSRIAEQNRVASQNPAASTDSSASSSAPAAGSFSDALTAASAGVTFSGHAQTRLMSRQIALTPADLQRLGSAIDRAATKGARSSLVLMDRPAGRVGLVVSVPNRTVITAVDTASLKENIFTNIDSAMII